MLSEDELALLDAIRETGSLSRAAARLGKAPSTISHAARQLETRFDALLFDRRRYRLQLPLHDGGRLAFRVTRGTFNPIERDAKGRLPPPHIAIGKAGATLNITVEAWSDDT